MTVKNPHILSETHTYSEPELILLLKRGEETAYGYLYDQYGPALYGVILHVVRQQEMAEDILQEVFLKIYRNIDHYETSKGRLYTWMLHIARNSAIDTVRSTKFRDLKKIQPLENTVNTTADNNASSIPAIDHIGLDKIISALGEDHRKIIELAYFQGYTQEEVSRELDIPLGTVKTRVRSALIQIRKLLNIS